MQMLFFIVVITILIAIAYYFYKKPISPPTPNAGCNPNPPFNLTVTWNYDVSDPSFNDLQGVNAPTQYLTRTFVPSGLVDGLLYEPNPMNSAGALGIAIYYIKPNYIGVVVPVTYDIGSCSVLIQTSSPVCTAKNPQYSITGCGAMCLNSLLVNNNLVFTNILGVYKTSSTETFQISHSNGPTYNICENPNCFSNNNFLNCSVGVSTPSTVPPLAQGGNDVNGVVFS